jgi:hypothetical protein
MTAPHSNGCYYNVMRALGRNTAVRRADQVVKPSTNSLYGSVGRAVAVVRLGGKFVPMCAPKGHLARVI